MANVIDLDRDPRELTLGHLLNHVCRLVRSRRQWKFESIGLYHGQALIVFRLLKADGIPQRILARDLHIAPPTASGTLKRMERDGWIRRQRDEADQRIVKVYLTEKSKLFYEEVHASFKELDNVLASALTLNEQKNLKASLVKVHQCLLQTSNKPSLSNPDLAIDRSAQ